jgi:hypothetical protein
LKNFIIRKYKIANNTVKFLKEHRKNRFWMHWLKQNILFSKEI